MNLPHDDDLLDDESCPGCGRAIPLWRLYPFHEPNGTRHTDSKRPPWPYLYDAEVDGFRVACEWDRDALRDRYVRRHQETT